MHSLNNGRPRYRKILEIGPIAPPRAGWSVRIDYVMKALREQGIETAALDVGPNRKQRRTHCDDVQSGWDYARKVLRYLRRGYRIHNHLNGESPKAYALVLYSTLLSRLFGRPPVLTWHGGIGYRWFPKNGNKLVDLIHRVIFGLSDRIICNDDKVKRHILDYGVRDKKVVPIPAFSRQYVEFERVALPDELERFLADHTPKLFSYVYFRPEFYLPVLVEALRQLVQTHPNLGLCLVGYTDGSEPTREALRRAGIEDHVFFTGDLSHDAFLTLLERCDLCVRTPQRDGISSSLLEALALGVPVVAAANALRPPNVVTYTASDPNDLAAKVDAMLRHRSAQRVKTPPPETVHAEIGVLAGSCISCR